MSWLNDLLNQEESRADGASINQICNAEELLGGRFADDYRKYLHMVGYSAIDGHELTGLCAPSRFSVVEVTQQEHENNPSVPSTWYVIEQANIDGIVIWQDASGTIYQTMPGTAPQRICGSLSEYVML